MGRAIPCLARRRRIRETTSPWDPLSDAKTTIVSFSKPNSFSASSIVPMTASPSKGGHACLSALALDWLHRRLAPDDCEPIHPGRTISAEGLCRRDKYGRARHRSHGGAALWRVPCSRRPKVRRGAALPAPMWARAATSELGWARAPMSCSAARNARSLSSRSRSKGRVGVTSPWGFRNSSSARRHDAMRAASSGTGFIRSPRRRWRAARHASTFGRVGAGACFD